MAQILDRVLLRMIEGCRHWPGVGDGADTNFRPTASPPEIDAANYAPRVKAPVLMLSGRHDAIFPYETAQLPPYRLLGAPADQKRHVTFAGGHSAYGWRDELDREGLDWLDRFFGPPLAQVTAGPRSP